MKKTERIKMVKAMEFIARQINDEYVFEEWLNWGVADGDIKYGDLICASQDEEDLDYYIEDEDFGSLMSCFLACMSRARKSGGLYCDEVVSA